MSIALAITIPIAAITYAAVTIRARGRVLRRTRAFLRDHQ